MPWNPTRNDEKICDEFAAIFDPDDETPEAEYSSIEQLGMFLGWLDEDWDMPIDQLNTDEAYKNMRAKMKFFAERSGMVYPPNAQKPVTAAINVNQNCVFCGEPTVAWTWVSPEVDPQPLCMRHLVLGFPQSIMKITAEVLEEANES